MGVPAMWNMAAKRMPEVVRGQARKEGVDLKADVYPYTFWQSNLRVIMLDRDYYNPEKVAKALEESGGADHMWFTSYKPDPALVGKTSRRRRKVVEDDTRRNIHEDGAGRRCWGWWKS